MGEGRASMCRGTASPRQCVGKQSFGDGFRMFVYGLCGSVRFYAYGFNGRGSRRDDAASDNGGEDGAFGLEGGRDLGDDDVCGARAKRRSGGGGSAGSFLFSCDEKG